jgi:hypothetical protein
MSAAKSSPQPDWGFGNFIDQMEQAAAAGRATIAALCPQLAELGVSKVRIAYDGYGDSGQIEGVTATAGKNVIELPAEMTVALIEAAEQALPYGWENNEGAFGELVLNVRARSLRRKLNWRYETSDYDEERWHL